MSRDKTHSIIPQLTRMGKPYGDHSMQLSERTNAEGSGMSPILANIYLNELDTHLEEYKANIKIGDSQKRKQNRSYTCFGGRISRLQKANEKVWNQLSKEDKVQRAKVVHRLQTDKLRMPTYPFRDTTYKNLHASGTS